MRSCDGHKILGLVGIIVTVQQCSTSCHNTTRKLSNNDQFYDQKICLEINLETNLIIRD